MTDLFMVFDVESIGLHGEGFAVGYVVIDRGGTVLEERTYACDPDTAAGLPKDRRWVDANVPRLAHPEASHPTSTPTSVRAEFWYRWLYWKEIGAVLVADCCWPVEARFLAACVEDCRPQRDWEGPYPLHDLASVMLALGRDPTATHARLPNELPAHHPLHDARQSARLLLEALSTRGVTATVKESLTAGAPEPQASEHCTWMQDGEADGTWFTDCGHAFNLEAGAPAENKMKFCCYCGKPTRAPGVATDGGDDAREP